MTVLENVEYGMRVRKVAARSDGERGRAGARPGAARRARRSPAGPALGRAAATRRARARDRQRARGAAARRAARRARPQAPPGDADRAQAHPARGRHHVRVRHARPGGGAHDERPHRRDEPGPHRAARLADRRLRAPRDRVRRRASSACRTSSTATAGASPCAPRRCACSTPTTRRRPARTWRRAQIVEVTYLGMLTRFVVALESGDRLVAVRQNLETAAADDLDESARAACASRGAPTRNTRSTPAPVRGGTMKHPRNRRARWLADRARARRRRDAARRVRQQLEELVAEQCVGQRQPASRAADRRHGDAAEHREGRGQAQRHRVGRLHGARVGEAVRDADRLQGQHQGRHARRATWCR